jgi:hypothetical protein
LREGKTVMHPGVNFDLTGNTRLFEQAAQFLNHWHGREIVVLGTGDVELARDFIERKMRALLRLTDQPGAVIRSGRSDAVGIARRSRQGVGTAHTVAVATHRTPLDLALVIDKRDHGSHIFHHRRDGHLGSDRTHPRVLRAARFHGFRAKKRISSGAVVEVGQQHVIADRRDAARHIAQFLTHAMRIHQ